MRDFYDLHVLEETRAELIDAGLLHLAFANTCEKRNTPSDHATVDQVLEEVRASTTMENRWQAYSAKSGYAAELAWATVLDSASKLLDAMND